MIIRKVLLPALLTGLLFALPFIFDILFFLIFISIACLFYFQDKLDIKIHKVTFLTISIAVWHFVVLFWFNHDVAVTFWDTIIIITFLIAVLLFFLNANIIAHKATMKWRFFIFIIFWISYEIMYVEWDLPFQMLSLGSVLGSIPSLIQWYSITGILGGTLWILIVNCYVLMLMQTKSKLSFKYLLCAYMIPIIVSLTMLFVPTKNENTVNVIAVNLKLDDGNYFEKTLSLLRRESDSSVQLIVCPEGIVHLPISSLPINKYFSSLKRLLDSKYINSSIILGCGLKFNDKFKSQKTEYYNLAIQCNYQGFVSYRNKKILVPFGEYIPYPKYLGRIDRIRNIVKKPISYYEAYDNLFYHNELIILPLICYELNFGNKIRKYYYGQKPNVITCIANEYAVPNSLYNTQFNRLAIIQAISFRKPVIKSSINGYASITNSKGKMIKSEYNSNEIIKEYIEMQTNRTLYAQFGYYPVLVLMVSAFFLTIKN